MAGQLYERGLGTVETAKGQGAPVEERDRAVLLLAQARLLSAQGEVEQAMKLHREALEVYQALGDLESQANARWEIGKIELARENLEAAVPMIAEAYQIVARIGQLEAICVIGPTLGRLLVAAGQHDEGLQVLRHSADGYRRLGRPTDAEAIEAVIKQIEGS